MTTKTKIENLNSQDLLEFISHQIYQSLADLHSTLAATVGEEKANDIVIDALSINLGHIIGQFDAPSQRKYANKTKKTIKEHTLLGTIQKDTLMHGQVGHS